MLSASTFQLLISLCSLCLHNSAFDVTLFSVSPHFSTQLLISLHCLSLHFTCKYHDAPYVSTLHL